MDIRWMAGFFDGEGCILVNQNGTTQQQYYLRVIIAQNQNPRSRCVLNYLLRRFGGSYYDGKNQCGSKKWVWQVYSKDAVAFLTAVGPHLQLKQPQVSVAFAFLNGELTGPQAERKMKRLKKAGV